MSEKGIDNFKEEQNLDEFSFKDITRIVRERKKIIYASSIVLFLIISVVTILTRIFSPTYQGRFSLLISDPLKENSRFIRPSNQVDSVLFEELARNTTSNDIPTIIELLKSPLLLKDLAETVNENPELFRNRINIAIPGNRLIRAKGVLNISYITKNKIQGRRIIEELSELYLKTALEQRQKRLSDGIEFLNTQFPSIEKETKNLQENLAEFRKKNNIIEPIAEGQILKSRVDNLSNSILNLESIKERLYDIKLKVENDQLTALGFQSQIKSNESLLGFSIRDPDEGLLQQIAVIENELAKARSKFKEKSSIIVGLQKKYNNLKPLVKKNQLESIETAISLVTNQISKTFQQRNELNKLFLKQPILIKEYQQLVQKLSISNRKLDGLINAREKFQLEIAQENIPWRIISPPLIDPIPIKPNVFRILSFGFFISFAFGVIVALMTDRLDNVFRSRLDVSKALKLPVLGQIPYLEIFDKVNNNNFFLQINEYKNINKNDSKKIDDKKNEDTYQRFFYQEAFRNIITSIKFLNTEKPIKIITITSSIPSEGKSLASIFLARTISELGKKVLLIDADLRKPQVHKRFEIDNIIGLSNYLAKTTTEDWKELVKPIEGIENLFVLTAGSKPPDPTRLLSSSRLKDFFDTVKDSNIYDYVIVDTPPLIGLSDAYLVEQHTDGLILLVSLNKVEKSIPMESLYQLKLKNSNILGTITNSPTDSLVKREPYSYGYKYKYSYGYSPTTYNHYMNDPAKETKNTDENLDFVRKTFSKIKKYLIDLKS